MRGNYPYSCLLCFNSQVNRSEVKVHAKCFLLVLQKGKGNRSAVKNSYFHASNKISYLQNVTTAEVAQILA